MTEIFMLVIVYLVSLHQAKADYYDDFVRDYQKKYPYLSPNPAEASQLIHSDTSCPGGSPGYPGEPIFDKNGKLIVFSGLPVSRKAAEEYAKNYNNKH